MIRMIFLLTVTETKLHSLQWISGGIGATGNYLQLSPKWSCNLLHFYLQFLSFQSCKKQQGWYERLGGNDNPLADAIMDRIAYNSYKINIESSDPAKDISMREVYGMDPRTVS